MMAWLSKLDPKWVVINVVGWGFLAVVLWRSDSHTTKMEDAHLKLVDVVAANSSAIVKVQDRQTPIIERIDRNTSK